MLSVISMLFLCGALSEVVPGCGATCYVFPVKPLQVPSERRVPVTLLLQNCDRWTKQKKPHDMWSSQKHKNIDALGSGAARTGACILAFFQVVASSQISPHSETSRQTVAFRAAKIVKKSYLQAACKNHVNI